MVRTNSARNSKFCKVAVLGSGHWGRALAFIAAANPNNRIVIYSRSPQRCAELQQQHNSLPPTAAVKISFTAELASAITAADCVFITIPTQEIRTFITANHALLQQLAPIPTIFGSKGIDVQTGKTPIELFAAQLGPAQLGVISGPNFASEIMMQQHSAAVIASYQPEVARLASKILQCEFFRPYLSSDATGIALCGALKNVLAIAAGILHGSDYGANSKAALICRGLAEIARYIEFKGGDIKSVYGLAGIGDIILCCSNAKSRNFAFGQQWAQDETTAQQPQSKPLSKPLVEGLATCRAIEQESRQLGIDMPICQGLQQLLDGKITLAVLLQSLFARPVKIED